MVTAVAIDVTVVVPVYNPGANIEPCLAALVDQTLPPERFEIVLVDDGSTDGTAAVLRAWADRHAGLVRVLSEPNSGWPGRPRNVGVDAAQGGYVQFVDNDDLLAPDALERMLAAARAGDADVVLGKLSSDFRPVNHAVYRHNAQRVTWADFPLVESLTPHKMFRTSLLREHDIRFGEGPRHLEDQAFCMHAYAHARSVSVVADAACYFYRRRRGFGRNAGDVEADPADYYRDLEAVLDVIDAHTDDVALRRRLYQRFLRVEMLGRLRDRVMLGYADDYRQRLFERVADLAQRRVPPAVDGTLPFFVRVQARALRAGDLAGLLAFAAELDTLAVVPAAVDPTWADGRLRLEVDAEVQWQGRPLTRDRAAAMDADVDDLTRDAAADVVVANRADSTTWYVDPPLKVVADDGVVRVRGSVALDPRNAAMGRALPAGLWTVRLRVVLGGITRTVRLPVPEQATTSWCLYDDAVDAVVAYRGRNDELALDVGGWMHDLAADIAKQAVAGARGWEVTRVVAGGELTRRADLLVDDGGGARRLPARLLVTADGARLEPHRRLAPGARAWLRVGPPGTAAPARLDAPRG
jgi:glycosyltransferase involved in cell wall biosynthesis